MRTLVVTALLDEGDVRTVTLADPAGWLLPAYVPGSHLLLDCGGRVNAYSLLDSGAAARSWRVAVLRDPAGRGGSQWVHEELFVGSTVECQGPRSAFAPVSTATRLLLVAGGIGVTPLLSHARAAQRRGVPVTLLYRSRAPLAEASGLPGVVRCGDRAGFAAALGTALRSQPLGTHLYVCGPAGFTDLVLAEAAATGWPEQRLHSERFAADVLDPGRPFRLRLGSSGIELDVPSGVSALQALEDHGAAVPSRCRQGVCGECLLPVKDGRPEHRDLFLSASERDAGDCVLPCVSRAAGEVLEVVV